MLLVYVHQLLWRWGPLNLSRSSTKFHAHFRWIFLRRSIFHHVGHFHFLSYRQLVNILKGKV